MRAQPSFRTVRSLLSTVALVIGIGAAPAWANPGAGSAAPPAPLAALSALALTPYLGTWYQVAWFPNRFQKQCVSDTTAQYSALPDGSIRVINRCRLADGRWDEAVGQAQPVGQRDGDLLKPAQLRVSFLPAALRWLPVGWGAYWVIQLAEDGRYAVVSEPSRQYLWVLSRTPVLLPADESAIRSRLAEQGFAQALAWQSHPHGAAR